MGTGVDPNIRQTEAAFAAAFADYLQAKVNTDELGEVLAFDENDADERAVAQWGDFVDDVIVALQRTARLLYRGTANPNGTQAAPLGSLYMRTSTGDVYRKQSEVTAGDSTGWVALSSSSEVLVDIDFTAEPTADFVAGGDDSYTIAGVQWSVLNTANADTFGLVNGTGLRFNADATSSEHTTATRTAPRLEVPIADLLDGLWDVTGRYIVEIHLSAWTNASGCRVQVCLDLDTAGTDRLLGGGIRNSSGNVQTFAISDTTANGTEFGSRTAVGVLLSASGALGVSGSYAGDEFPEAYTEAGGYQAAVSGFGSPMDQGAASLVLAFPSQSTTHDATIERLRIRRVR